MDNWKHEEEKVVRMFGSDEEVGNQIPTQAQTIVEGSGAVLISEFKPVADVDYLQVCNYCVFFFISICGKGMGGRDSTKKGSHLMSLVLLLKEAYFCVPSHKRF